MELKSLLLSSDEKTVRVLRRVLSDLEIRVEHCSKSEEAVHRITRQRFEAIIVDCSDNEEAGNVLRASKAAPVNKRALSIVLVEGAGGLKSGFDMGAHFVLHKPLAVERAKASFRAVRALMKSERRLQMRVPVQVPVSCLGGGRFQARTLDICEGGMAIQFIGRAANQNKLRFSLELPGMPEKLEISGELAWEGDDRAGVRFKDVTEAERTLLRNWLNTQLPELEPEDPPVICRVTELSPGACYLTTVSPFPKATRVILTVHGSSPEVQANGVVRLTHSEYGMGVEFLQATPEQQEQVRLLLETLNSGEESAELRVEPDGLETATTEEASASLASDRAGDTLVDLLRKQPQVPVETFLQKMQQSRHMQASG